MCDIYETYTAFFWHTFATEMVVLREREREGGKEGERKGGGGGGESSKLFSSEFYYRLQWFIKTDLSIGYIFINYIE